MSCVCVREQSLNVPEPEPEPESDQTGDVGTKPGHSGLNLPCICCASLAEALRTGLDAQLRRSSACMSYKCSLNASFVRAYVRAPSSRVHPGSLPRAPTTGRAVENGPAASTVSHFSGSRVSVRAEINAPFSDCVQVACVCVRARPCPTERRVRRVRRGTLSGARGGF